MKAFLLFVIASLGIITAAQARTIIGYDSNNNYKPVVVEEGRYYPGVAMYPLLGAPTVLQVYQGGTGGSSFTAGECLKGNGTGAQGGSAVTSPTIAPYSLAGVPKAYYEQHDGISINVGANNGNLVMSYGIDDTLSYLTPTFVINPITGAPTMENFCFLEALDVLTDITVDISNLVAYSQEVVTDFGANVVQTGSGAVELVARIGSSVSVLTSETILYSKSFSYTTSHCQ